MLVESPLVVEYRAHEVAMWCPISESRVYMRFDFQGWGGGVVGVMGCVYVYNSIYGVVDCVNKNTSLFFLSK